VKRLISTLCLLLCLVLLFAGCSTETDVPQQTRQETQGDTQQETQEEIQQETTEEVIPTDAEIQKAIDLGFVPESLQGDYDSKITYGHFCGILDNFVSVMFPDSLEEWKTTSQKYRQHTKKLMSRMEGALVLLYAAECVGVDDVGFRYYIPLEELIADDVDFYEGVTWDYQLLPDIRKPYYNETIANSEYVWRCGLDYADNAKFFVEYMSYGNGKTYFDYDERYSLNLGEAFTRGDAIRAVERLYENARFAQYVPVVEVSCTVSDDALALGANLPAVSPQQLPDWKGYTVIFGRETAIWGAGMLYDKEYIEVLGELGFDFIRAPLDSRMIFNGSDMTMVNPAYLETMDDLIEYCAEEGIHVCFDLHDMPGFYTGGDDSKITLWHDEEAQNIFVEFWRFMAEYYKDVPTNLLSFNLLNEPHDMNEGPSDKVYSEIMLRAIDAIRETSPERLIFADMLGAFWGTPVQGLANAQVVQTIHPYFLQDGTEQWSAPIINGAIQRQNGVLTLNGDFPAGTKITAAIETVCGGSTFHIEADGTSVASMELGTEAPGESGCIRIREEGTPYEVRDYDNASFAGELATDCQQIKLVQKGGWWYHLKSITIETGAYTVSIVANRRMLPNQTVPTLTIDQSGNVSAKEEGTLIVQPREWIESAFRSYREFTEETGTPIMVQEFGFNDTIDYQATLAAADDLLSVLDAYDVPWCSWYGNYGPVLDVREYQYSELFPGYPSGGMREGAEYKPVSENYMIDTGLMEVFQKYMK